MPQVTLPGWDASRTDNDPKQVFGKFAQDWVNSGKQWGAEGARAFVAQDPRWEIMNANSNDPLIRVKQDALNTWKPGQSIWQDVVRDSGPGGANAPSFSNAAGYGPTQAPAQAPYAVAPQNPYAAVGALLQSNTGGGLGDLLSQITKVAQPGGNLRGGAQTATAPYATSPAQGGTVNTDQIIQQALMRALLTNG